MKNNTSKLIIALCLLPLSAFAQGTQSSSTTTVQITSPTPPKIVNTDPNAKVTATTTTTTTTSAPVPPTAPASTVMVPMPALAPAVLVQSAVNRLRTRPELNAVYVSGGVSGSLILTGEVGSETDRLNASDMLKGLPGLVSIDNRLTVVSNVSKNLEKAQDTTKEVVSDLGEGVSDTWITAKVKTQLQANNLTNQFSLDVNTTNQVVTLVGVVPTQKSKNDVVAVVKTIKGVRSVNARRVKIG